MLENFRRIFILFGIILIVTLSTTTASAKTIYVDDDDGVDFTKIQGAINAASSGDTIVVYNGTYYENVIVNKQLTLKGIGYPIVEAKGKGRAIKITVDRCNLDGFKAINSGGRYVGIHLNADYCNISNNIVSNSSKGIGLFSSSNNTLVNNTLTNNKNGISLYGPSSNNTLTNNIANSNNYNGIGLVKSNDNNLTNNTANSNKYGIRLSYSSNNNLANNTVNSNDNGIDLYKSSNNNIKNNNASSNREYGIFLSKSGINTITNNEGTVHRELSTSAIYSLVMILGITALAIGPVIVKTGPTISNTFYGLGSFTAVVTIVYVLAEVQIPGLSKVITLFVIAFMAIGMGYSLDKRKEVPPEKVDQR